MTLAVGDKAPSTLVGQIAYLPFGPLQRLTWGNGITLSREYDQDYQLLRQKVGPWQSDYQHDANGNIQQHRHSLWGTLDYQYDPLDRLTEERGVQGGRSYALRRGRQPHPTQRQPRLRRHRQQPGLPVRARQQPIDRHRRASGDQRRRRQPHPGPRRAQTGLRRPGPPAKRQPRRPAGRRIPLQRPRPAHRQAHPESITTYLYGPDGQLLGEAEHDGSGRKLRAQYYLWLDSLPLATIDADYDAQGKVGNPTLLYLHGDHLDTPRLATDASGQIAWQWQSDAFGRGEALSQGSTQVNLRFPGQYYDAESGLHYNYFRDYDPETGRYVESDPIGLSGGVNTYGYVQGAPQPVLIL